MGLAGFFLAVTMPLLLSAEWVTASWAVQALLLVWIARKLGSEFVRHAGLRAVCGGDGAVLFCRLARSILAGPAVRQLGAGPIICRSWCDGCYRLAFRSLRLPRPIACSASRPADGEGIVDRANDIPPWIGGNWAMRLLMIGAVVTLFVYLDVELEPHGWLLLRTGAIAGAHAGMARPVRAILLRIHAIGELACFARLDAVVAADAVEAVCLRPARLEFHVGLGVRRTLFVSRCGAAAGRFWGGCRFLRSGLLRCWRPERRPPACEHFLASPAWRCSSSI